MSALLLPLTITHMSNFLSDDLHLPADRLAVATGTLDETIDGLPHSESVKNAIAAAVIRKDLHTVADIVVALAQEHAPYDVVHGNLDAVRAQTTGPVANIVRVLATDREHLGALFVYSKLATAFVESDDSGIAGIVEDKLAQLERTEQLPE